MRCYCTSPDNCTCDGVPGTLTEVEARLEILKERKQLYGGDSVERAIAKVEREIKAMSRPSGRDLYLQRLTNGPVGDRWPEPEDDETEEDREQDRDDSTHDTDALSGRDAYLRRLAQLCDEYGCDYQRRLSQRTVRHP